MMKLSFWIVAALMMFLQPCIAQDAGLFTDQSYADAKQSSIESGKPLLVYATTEYGGPNDHMNRTTWKNKVFLDWINDNAIAIKVNLYSDREVAQALSVFDAPTTIILREGRVVHRGLGYSSAPDLLRELGETDVAEQASKIDREQHRWKIDDAEDVDLFDISMKINDLVREEDYELALAGYVWLWKHGPKHRDHPGGRSTYCHASEIHDLAMVYPPAMRQFRIFRNTIERTLSGENSTYRDLEDWILLNEAVDEQERTIAWVIRIQFDDRFVKTFHRAEYEIQSLLTEKNMWMLLGEIHPSPFASVKQDLQPLINQKKQMELIAKNNDDAQPGFIFPDFTDMDMIGFHSDMNSEIYAACLAANRDDEAKQIAQLFHQLDTDGSLHILLVRQALRANAIRKRHLKMIDQANQMGTDRPDLRILVERMLGVTDEDVKDDGVM